MMAYIYSRILRMDNSYRHPLCNVEKMYYLFTGPSLHGNSVIFKETPGIFSYPQE